MSRRTTLTRYPCTCTNNFADGTMRCSGRTHLPLPCHLAGPTAPNAFTASTSHPSQRVPSDTIHTYHFPGISSPDPLMTYKKVACSETPYHPACGQTPIMQPPIRQSLNSPVYHGPNLHFCSSQGVGDNHSTHHSSDRSRSGNIVQLNGPEFSYQLPVPQQQQHFHNSSPHNDTSMPFSDDECHPFSDFSSLVISGDNPENTVYGSSGNNPTLAPAVSFDDFDFNTMLETHQSNQCAPCIPQGMILHGLTTTGNDQTASDPMLEPNTPGFGEQWRHNISHPPASSLDMMGLSIPSAAHSAPKSDAGCSEIHPSLPPLQQFGYPSGSASCPPLPDLPASPGFVDELHAYAADHNTPTTQFYDWSPLFLASRGAQYPDPEAFHFPISSPPDLTSASTTPSRQQGSRAAQRNTSTDVLLVQMRLEGKSYKEIKEALGLEEAESTLRGRHRSLTKPKEARVRKPEWTTQDVSIPPLPVISKSQGL